ncbi:inner-membrane translocator [Actinoplanes sp. SE50]|uniref:inner-membrane translocator n=1 Tax=unclassified Actinoplanes TaxID=2626549 RepID=UPI00023EE00B|nr:MULTISPECIES: inner-membrane translocator [unclassified Actinoplanes]AEV88953.1 inner-membrane translocator [Actinoplanes sp. SE50/110]ATO87359.1 inner-membrane translocator [Actinoplanes sp. SE50]SLM04777.1 inner-membrane translocator [Actinoplanes sp. SE50/110]
MAYDEATTDPAAYRRRVQLDDTAGGGNTLDQSLSAPVPAPPVADDGRDRLGIHLGWEVVLLVVAAVLGFLLWRESSAAFQRPALDGLLVTASAIGLVTLGAGLSLRAGVPNLAIGPIVLAAEFQFAENGDKGLLESLVPALLIAAAGGLIVGVLILVLHVPGWAATLAAALGVITFDQLRVDAVAVQGTWEPTDRAFLLFGGFAILAVLGAGLGAIGPIRRFFGRMRPVGDPAGRRGAAVVLPVLVALIVSTVFAAGAGVIMAGQSAGPIRPGTGLEWTGIGLGLALLGGTSAFGRRGGIFGSLFAVVALTLFLDYQARRELHISLYATAGVIFLAGLIATRVVESYGRLASAARTTDWNAAPSGGLGTNWSPTAPETWNTPATPVGTDRWDDGPWGATR